MYPPSQSDCPLFAIDTYCKILECYYCSTFLGCAVLTYTPKFNLKSMINYCQQKWLFWANIINLICIKKI